LYIGRENPNIYRQLVCIMAASEVDRLANAISTGDDDYNFF
jgi:uncharacterized protein (DUF1501 family)